jgi:hypothetical protein
LRVALVVHLAQWLHPALLVAIPTQPAQAVAEADVTKTTFGADQTTKNAILTEVNSAGGTVVFGPSDTWLAFALLF